MALFVLLNLLTLASANLFDISHQEIPNFLEQYPDSLRVVYFYSSSDSKCKEVSTKLAQVASKLPQVKFARVEAQSTPKVPYIKYYLAGSDSPKDYTGLFEVDKMTHSFKNKVYAIEGLGVPEDLPRTLRNRVKASSVIIGLFKDMKGQQIQSFKQFAKKHSDEFKFMIAKRKKDWVLKEGHKNETIIIGRGPVIAEPYETKFKNFTDFKTLEDIENIIYTNYYPSVQWMDRELFFRMKQKGLPVVLLMTSVDPETSPSNANYFISSMYEAMEPIPDHSGKYTLGATYIDEFLPEVEQDNLEHEKMLLFIYQEDKRYLLKESDIAFGNGTLKIEKVTEFVQQHQNQQLEPFEKNNQPRLAKYKNSVKVLSSENFVENVMNSKKHELVYVYSSKHKESVDFIKEVEQVAKTFRSRVDIEFNRIDSETNTLPPEYSKVDDPSAYIGMIGQKHEPILMERGRLAYDKIYYFVKNNLDKKEDL